MSKRALPFATVAVALFIALSAAGLVTTRTVDAAGVVLDARTGAPLAGVSVRAGTAHDFTDSFGRFWLASARAGSPVLFRLTNYVSASTPARADLRVELVPIPVTGVVTSAFTKAGLRATVGPVGTRRTGNDGTFTLYGVGPGDTITIAAFGHRTATIAVDQTRKVRVVLELSALEARQLLPAVPGYGYLNADPTDEPAKVAALRSRVPELARQVTSVAMRRITRDGGAVGIAFGVAIDPEYASRPETPERWFTHMTEDARLVDTPTVDGVSVQVNAPADGGYAYTWQRYAGFVVVVGDRRDALDGFARALIAAQR